MSFARWPVESRALTAAVALALTVGLWGIRWGLPDARRLRVFPPHMQPSNPEVARHMADAWRELYREIEKSHSEMRAEEPVTYVQNVEIVELGWKFPPPKLLNSYRSFLLQLSSDEKKSFIILSQMRP